jgi:anion-transporting  ArsA/GET3 family ATPase
MQAFTSTGKLSLNLVGKGAALLLRGLSKFTGAEFLDSIAEFVTDLNDLFGGFRQRAEEVSAALRRPDVAFVIVTSPSPLAIDEALFFHRRLEEYDMRPDAFVINAVHPLLSEPRATTAELEASAEAALPEGADARRAVRRMQKALDDARLLAVADRLQADRLENETRGRAVSVEVPAFDEDVHDLAGLAEVARYLMETRS